MEKACAREAFFRFEKNSVQDRFGSRFNQAMDFLDVCEVPLAHKRHGRNGDIVAEIKQTYVHSSFGRDGSKEMLSGRCH